MFQESAVRSSSEVGWDPPRYLAQGTAFVVVRMTVVHDREITYGQNLRATTWVRDFRRGILSKREVRLTDDHGDVARGTQQWAHVSASLKPVRACQDLCDSFIPRPDLGQVVTLPALDHALEGPVHTWAFQCWRTWMDPLGHANHPVYVDWCDEALSRLVDHPEQLVAVAEQVAWKSGAVADDTVRVTSQCVGRDVHGALVFTHRLERGDGQLLATARTHRALATGAFPAHVSG